MPDGSTPPTSPSATEGGDGDRAATVDSRKRPPAWRIGVIALVSGGVVAAIVAGAGPARIADVFAGMGWTGVLHLLSLYMLAQLLRAVRVAACLPHPRPSLARIFAVVCMHQFLNHVIPARLGELSFPLLASRYGSVSIPAATRLLIVIRIYEFIILGVFFLGAASELFVRAGALFLIGSIVACAALLLVLILLLVLGIPTLLRVVRGTLDRISILRWRTSALRLRILAGIDALLGEFVRKRPAKESLSVALLSVLIWVLLFWISFEALRYAGIDVTFLGTIVGSSFANASHVLPINTFGSIGSLEAGWTFGFVLIGVPAKAALASGFALHVVGIAFLSLAASASWIALQYAAPRSAQYRAPK